MDFGSIDQVTQRLLLWCARRDDRGFARVEWDSVFSRQKVVDRLTSELGPLGIPLTTIELPPGQPADKTVADLMDKLRFLTPGVVSITGVEWAFPEGGDRLETFVALSFKRELLASLPIHQIWWIPSSLTERFILGVPDLDSWFQLKLHLTEIPASLTGPPREIGTTSVKEARELANRFWERIHAARARSIPEERIWTELAQPALELLISAGLYVEADKILDTIDYPLTLLEKLRLSPESDPQRFRTLVFASRLARFLSERGHLSRARSLQERLLGAVNRNSGAESPESVVPMSDLAITLNRLGDYAAARHIEERVVELATAEYGAEHRETLGAMNNLASTLLALGEIGAARRLQERIVESSKRNLGEGDINTLTAQNNLSSILRQQGDYSNALRLNQQVVEGRTRAFGGTHAETLDAMNNFALTLLDMGDLDSARKVQERVLEISKDSLGEEHPFTLAVINNLALTLQRLGDLSAARGLQELVVAATTRSYGERHPNALTAMNNLAAFLFESGESQEALRLLRDCLARRQKVLGPNHPDTIATAELLAHGEAEATLPTTA